MAGDLDLVARLLAYETGRAVPLASHQQVALRPDALILCPLAMAGEDTTVHIVACGRSGQPPKIWCVPDPRRRDDQFRLFTSLGVEIEQYFSACRDAGTYPQLWVSSTAAIRHLDTLADRLRYNRDDLRVKRFGELLSYATERYPTAGQQTLIAATRVLRTHWATGQQEGEDEHLGALLAWIASPPGRSVLVTAAEAEREPMGVKTDPEFDRDILGPRVAAYHDGMRRGIPAAALRFCGRAIRTDLEPVVTLIYRATQTAIATLRKANLPPHPDLPALERREAEEFSAFMASRDAGYHLPLRDQPKLAAFKLSAREDAIQNVEAALRRGDRVDRARGRLSGHVIVGEVADPFRFHVGPRRFEYRFDLISDQRTLRVRRRDDLSWVEDPRLGVTVTDVHRDGQATRISLLISKGQRSVGLPHIGQQLELVPGVPNWENLLRIRGHLKRRLETMPWTHASAGIPPARPRFDRPADPLAAVEALR